MATTLNTVNGIETSKIQALLPAFREELGNLAEGVSDDSLLKFLYWKPGGIKRPAERFRAHVKWRKENPFGFETVPLLASSDERLKSVIESEVIVAPEGMVDKGGSTVFVGRLRNNDMSDGRTAQDVARMVLYTIDRALERESTLQHGITIFHDLTGITRANVDTAIPRLIFKALFGHFPVRITAIYIYNAPSFFPALFSVVSLLMPAKVRSRVKFVKDMSQVYAAIDREQLLEEHGGKRVYDGKEWVRNQIKREQDGTMHSLKDCLVAK